MSFYYIIQPIVGATQSAQSALGSVIGVLVVLGSILFWALKSRKKVQGELGEAQLKLSQTSEDLKSTRQTQKQGQQNLDKKTTENTKLKNDLGAQKKKNHTLQEELKPLRKKVETLEAASSAEKQEKPAYQAEKTPKPKPAPVKMDDAPAHPDPDPAPALAAKQDNHEQRLKDFEDELAKLRGRLKEEKDSSFGHASEMKTMRRQLENYRRIDLMTRSKFETLEDQLNQMGRKYYDAVSEVALLKGEIVGAPLEQATTTPPSQEQMHQEIVEAKTDADDAAPAPS
jgi:DNA repair exonuclease SbcCD ATPase subunit